MQTSIFLSVLATVAYHAICEEQCGPPHEVDRAKISNPSDSGYALESTVTYKCDYGFVTGGTVKISKCIQNPVTEELVWTKPEITCNPRSCEDPGFVENSRRSGSRFTFPNTVEYICNEGYQLSGQPKRYCQASGAWSGRLPSCNVISCSRPSDPENGKAIYTSLEYDSELTYECNAGLEVSSDLPRKCDSNGEWTGNMPFCKEIECELPDKPEFGSMELVGNKAKVGSLVLYKCNPGLTLIGSSSSKCIKNNGTGEWMFPTPQCVEPCIAPSISNGDLGKFVEEYRRYRWTTVFQKIQPGTKLEENEEVKLKCNQGFVVPGQQLSEVTVKCLGGELLPEPQCVSTSCRQDDPPATQNGEAVVSSYVNGHVIWYRCYAGFIKLRPGYVQCVNGRWTGTPPVCGTTQCQKESLNYPGLVRGVGLLRDGQSFEPKCIDGYEVTENSNKNIICNRGEWTGNLPPCTPATGCKTESLLSYTGLILQGHRRLSEGEWIEPMCAEGFEFSNKEDSKIYCREGTWVGNIPPCTPAHCFSLPPVPEHGKIKSFYAKGHGSAVEYECQPFYEIHGTNTVMCAFGTWSGSAPSCRDTRCYKKDLSQNDGVDLTNDEPTYSGRDVVITCLRGYTLKYPSVSCWSGKWQTENLLSPCQEDPCAIGSVSNGALLEKRTESIRNWFGRETGVKTTYIRADRSSSKTTGDVLYVMCNDGYNFQGDENSEIVEVTCRRGQWTPLPICHLPGVPISTEIQDTLHEDISAATPGIDNNLGIVGEKEVSTNSTVEGNDDDNRFSTLDNNGTENKKESLTDPTTLSPTCFCKYMVDDSNMKGYNGKKIYRIGDEIESGTVVEFYCQNVGLYRLRGSTTLTCPPDCIWHSSQFPSCVQASDDDVIITVTSRPEENMRIGIGGVVTVVPETDISLACRAKTGTRKPVSWSVPPSSSGAKQQVHNPRNDVFITYYTILKVKYEDSGSYTCYRNNGLRHSIEIKVADIWCPKIEESGDLIVSYSGNNRSFKSTAYFHCFSPNKREGPSLVTCEASGQWSQLPPTCQLPTCSIGDVYDIIPVGVVPTIEEGVTDHVPYGYVLKLFCEESGRVIKGSNTATCSTDGKWITQDKVRCVQGCEGLKKKSDSDLMIIPQKEFYNFGESIMFSCPAGKRLSQDVERILCFGSGWTPSGNTPDCL